MAKVIVILMCAILVGCATKTQIEYVQIPPKQPPIIERPLLETERLKQGDDPGIVIQAHRLAIKQLQKWGLELEAALDAYRTKDEKK